MKKKQLTPTQCPARSVALKATGPSWSSPAWGFCTKSYEANFQLGIYVEVPGLRQAQGRAKGHGKAKDQGTAKGQGTAKTQGRAKDQVHSPCSTRDFKLKSQALIFRGSIKIRANPTTSSCGLA